MAHGIMFILNNKVKNMITFNPVEDVKLKNVLEIYYRESHTNVNEYDTWTEQTCSCYNNVSKEDAEILMRCFSICEKEFDISRKAYGGHGIPYNQLYLDEKEEYVEEFENIEVSNSDRVIFTKNGKEYDIWYNFDMGMPTEDARYFAGLKLDSALYYDENGNKFSITIS